MNMFKKNGGFTLVELIVVIAILAILAGVAVPMYSGYITKANEAADYTQLDSMKTAAVFACTEKHNSANITEIAYTAGDNASVVVTFTGCADTCSNAEEHTAGTFDATDAVKALMGNSLPTMQSGATGATWTVADGWDLAD